jgi:NAD+ kinase
MSGPGILVVHRRSAYTDIVTESRHPTIKKLIRAGDPLIASYVAAHESHIKSMDRVRQTLVARGLDFLWRHHIDDLNPDDFNLVVTVGGDGTVLHASHAIEKTPVLAVNSSPSTSVGFFTCTDAAGFGAYLDQALEGRIKPMTLSRMEVSVNEKIVTDRALNDVLFCHDCPASMTRYVLTFNGSAEDQISSGVWVGTAAGSTAALKAAGGCAMSPRSKRLQYVVREPFPRGGVDARQFPRMVKGMIPDGERLVIFSKTEVARLYVDGPHVVFSVNFGDRVTYRRSDKPLSLFIDVDKKA